MLKLLLSLTLSLVLFSPCHASVENKINQTQKTWQIKKESQWYPLYHKLKKDGFTDKELQPYFRILENNYSQKPMGNKVKELYQAKFAPKKKPPKKTQKQEKKENKLGIPYPWYPGYVTTENAKKCKKFIEKNKEFFAKAEKQYKIPKEVLSALIYVETWHGKFLGKFNPLIMLGSMAISTDLAMLPDYTKQIKLNDAQNQWMQNAIIKKADWAYTELKALLTYSIKNNIDITKTPSSIYGAIGYGQFMPTNIPRFAIDGNNDNIIDLFHAPDAILSVANFLHKQGWKTLSPSFNTQVKVLKRYNYSNAYAHTILALAKLTKQQSH